MNTDVVEWAYLEDILKGKNAFRQLSVPLLTEHSLSRKEAVLTSSGAIRALTGTYTGRSPKDKYIVDEPSVRNFIDWGTVNQPLTEHQFERLLKKSLSHLQHREFYVFDGFAGAHPAHRLPVRFINEYAWHNLFVHQLFIRPTEEELAEFSPSFTVIAVPGCKADPKEDGTRSETFIVISFERRIVLIGGTEYAGEMKKSIFTVLNYLLPLQGILPMHCSANVGEKGDVALFFGLSGTGKTTLSADPQRRLIGDDEHGWSEEGVFNFEGGCYAKCIGLVKEKEPQIYQAIRFGSVLENVVIDEKTRIADYKDPSLTENTRAAYPIDYIENAVIPGVGGHPKVIFFLTADAFGVLPPIARLDNEQAMYHFLSGYTSKLAGTERGIKQPEATFSACFGAPFLPHRPEVYARMLGEKIKKHRVRVYLINTGWTGGPYGVGQRIPLAYTRAMLTSVLNGEIENVPFHQDPVFGLFVPERLKGIPDDILHPRRTWKDPLAYDAKAEELSRLFEQNFQKFAR